ncbi:hypothetical protein ABPG72_006471 [Tetrahymena utriculariae]
MNNKEVKIQKDSQIKKQICQQNFVSIQEKSYQKSEMYEKQINIMGCYESKANQKDICLNPLLNISYLENAIPCLQESCFKNSQNQLQSLQFSLEDAIYDDSSHHKSGYFDQFRTQNQYYTVDDIFCLLEQNYQCKILIQGQAGVGKTTLMQYIAQEWSQKNIQSERFSEIYFISLKTLLNKTWAEKFLIDQQYSDEFQINPLKFLIHTNVSTMNYNQGYIYEIKPEDIKLNSDKVLLLIDGLNEISSVQDEHTVCLVLKQIFDQQNIIFTSRTNTLSIYWKNKFDTILENIGFNKLQILQYIENHIEQQLFQTQLYKIIIENKELYKISCIPANLAILCQVAALIKDDLQSLKIDGLYQLYRLFFQKLFERFDQCANNVAQQQNQQKFSQMDLIRLLAYLCQTEQILETECQEGREDTNTDNKSEKEQIESCLIKNLDQFVKLGLIKQQIYDKKTYCFTHLLFQEFFAAEYFVEKLQNGNQQKKIDLINYISQHRNEERMLQVLKFMSEIIINLRDQSVLDEFWYSMSCNIEGMLEFDITQKVKLLMHLIGSTNNQSENDILSINNTIPNINKIKVFIDLAVIFDLNEFKNELMHSGYKSKILSQKIQSLLEGVDNTPEVLIEIKNQIINYNIAIDIDSVERYYKNQKDFQSSINLNQQSQLAQDKKISNQIYKLEELNCKLNKEFNQINDARNEKQEKEMINKSLGLNMAYFYSQIDQKILQQSILDTLSCNSVDNSTKSMALKIIIKQLQNEFDFNNQFYQKIFEWIIETEQNYQASLQKISKNSYEFQGIQDKNAEAEDKNMQMDCFYCQYNEFITRQSEEVLHEQMILILKYLNSFNLNDFYQCLNNMTKYLLHYQKNLLPLVFEIIVKIRQQSNQNYIHIKLGQTTLHELVKTVANHVLDFPNFLQIWRTFSDEIKNILLDNLECSQCLKKEAKEYPNYINLIIQYANNQTHRDQLIFKFYKLNCQKIQTSFLMELLTNISDQQLKEQIIIAQTNILINKQQQQFNCEYFTDIIQLIEQYGNHQVKIQHIEQLITYYFSLLKATPRYFQSDIIKQLQKIPNIEEIKHNLLFSFIQFIKDHKNLEYLKTDKTDVYQILENNTQSLVNYLESLFHQDGRFHYFSLDLFIQILLIQNSKNLVNSLKFLLKNFFQYYFEQEQKISQNCHDEIFQIISSISLPYSLLIQIIDFFIPLFKIDRYFQFQKHFILNSSFEDQQNSSQILENLIIKKYLSDKENLNDSLKEQLIDDIVLLKLKKDQMNSLKNKIFTFIDEEIKNLSKSLLQNEQITKSIRVIINYISIFQRSKVSQFDFQQIIQFFSHLVELPFNLNLFDLIFNYFDEIILSIDDDSLKVCVSNELFQHLYNIDSQTQQKMSILLYSKLRYADCQCFQQEIIKKCTSDIAKWNSLQSRQLQYSLMDLIKTSNKIQNLFIKNNIQKKIINSIKTEEKNFLVQNVQQDPTFCVQLKMKIYSELAKICQIFSNKQQSSYLGKELQGFIKEIMTKSKQDVNLFLKIETDYINSLLQNNYSQQALQFAAEHLASLINLISKNEKLKGKIIEKCNLQIDCINNQTIQEMIIKQLIELLVNFINQNESRFEKVKFHIVEIIILIKKHKNFQSIPSLIILFINCLLQYQDQEAIQYIISVQEFCLLQLIPEKEALEIRQNVQKLFQSILQDEIQKEWRVQIEFHKQMCSLQIPFLSQISFEMLVLKIELDFKYRLKAFEWIVSRNNNVKYYFDKVLTRTSTEFVQKFFDHFYEYISEINKIYVLIDIIERYQSHFMNQQSLISQFNVQLKKMKYQNKFYRFKFNQKDLELQIQNFVIQLKSLQNEKFSPQKQIEIGLILIQFLNKQHSDDGDLTKECKILLKNIALYLNEAQKIWILQNLNYIQQLSSHSKHFISLITPMLLSKQCFCSNQNDMLYEPIVKDFQALSKILCNSENYYLDNKANIFVDSIKYKINNFYVQKLNLDRKIIKILNKKKIFFTEQYTNYTPIFQNLSQLLKSPLDQQKYSIITNKRVQEIQNKEQVMIDSHWKLVELVDYYGDTICFFEKRDAFGKRVIIKINQETEENMIKFDVIFNNFKQRIFGDQEKSQLYLGKIYSNPFNSKDKTKIQLSKTPIKWNEVADFKHINCAFYPQINLQENKQKIYHFDGYLIVKPMYLIKSIQIKLCSCLVNWDDIQNNNTTQNCYQQFQFFKRIFAFDNTFELYQQISTNLETNKSVIKNFLFYQQTEQQKQYEQLLADNLKLHFPNDEKIQQQFTQYFRGFVKTLTTSYLQAVKIANKVVQIDNDFDKISTLFTIISITPLVIHKNLKKYQTLNELLSDEQIIQNSQNLMKFISDSHYLSSRTCRLALSIILKYQNQLFTKGPIDIFKKNIESKNIKNVNYKQQPAIDIKEKIQNIISSIDQCNLKIDNQIINTLFRGEKEILGSNHACKFLHLMFKNQQDNSNYLKIMQTLDIDFLGQNLSKFNQSVFKNKIF